MGNSSRPLRIAILLVFGILGSAVFVGALLSDSINNIAYAPLRQLVLPDPEPVTISVLYSTEKAAWLDEVISDFYATNPNVNGRPIQIELAKAGSREIYLAVLDGAQPDVISTASSLQISILHDLSEIESDSAIVDLPDTEDCFPVLETPLVLVSWKERAAVLWGDNPGNELWNDLHAAVIDPQGWDKLGHPEWGYVKFGQTSPLTSNSGFMTTLLLAYEYFHKTSGLTTTDILSDSEFQEWFLDFQNSISEFGDSTGTYMHKIITYGPSAYDVVAVYEATAIEQAENAVGRYGELKVYYPPATVMSDHPFCILKGDWVTKDKAQAARIFIEFLTQPEAQELALMQYGFRPVDRTIPLDQAGSPFNIYKDNGLNTVIPPEVEIPPGNVLDTLLDFWSRNVQQ
jgi:ABC-type sulfate transport system substrate-binding protein